jgi:hypothetical protein
MNGLRLAKAVLMSLMLAGCAGGPQLLSDPPPAAAEKPQAAADAPNMPSITPVQNQPFQNGDMPGRWILAEPHAPVCGMMFYALPGMPDGTIVPEGGCPERFYTSRRWSLRQNSLIIADDKNRTLATLVLTSGKFVGTSESQTPVTLSR